MKTLKLDLDTAKKLYPDASKEFKILLEENFGKNNLVDLPIYQRITCMKDVYEHLDVTEYDILLYKNPNNAFERRLNNIARLQLVAECYNEGSVADYNDSSQYKHYPYFKKASGSWSVYGYLCGTCGSGGSLVIFKNKESALAAGNNFLDIYSEIIEG